MNEHTKTILLEVHEMNIDMMSIPRKLGYDEDTDFCAYDAHIVVDFVTGDEGDIQIIDYRPAPRDEWESFVQWGDDGDASFDYERYFEAINFYRAHWRCNRADLEKQLQKSVEAFVRAEQVEAGL